MKKPKQLKPPKTVLDKANAKLQTFDRNTWPEDEWFGIGRYWDLNVYNFVGKRWATLYRVYPPDWQTDTSVSYSLYESDFTPNEQSELQKILDADHAERLARLNSSISPEAFEAEMEKNQAAIDDFRLDCLPRV